MAFTRRLFYLKAGAALSFAVFVAGLVLAPALLPVFRALLPRAVRPGGFTARFLWWGEPHAAAAYIAVPAALFFAAFCLFFMLFFFRRSGSAEIRYFEAFAFSFSFEILRFALPLQTLYGVSPFYALTAERFLLFFRFAGLFALFAAGLFVAGLKPKNHARLIAPFCLAALLVALRIPVDVYAFDAGLNPLLGFAGVVRTFETAAALITGVSFLAGALGRGLPEYAVRGLGAAMLMLGKSALQSACAPLALALAVTLLAAGFYLYVSRLRAVSPWQ